MSIITDAKEFAERYAGKIITIKVPIYHRVKATDDAIKNIDAMVVGYVDDIPSVLVVPEESNDWRYLGAKVSGWNITVLFPKPKKYFSDSNYGNSYHHATIGHCYPKPEPIYIKPYPNKCPSCKSPARTIAGNVLCSNVRCKAAAKVRAKYRLTKPVEKKQVIYELSTGKRVYIEERKNNACVVCGKTYPELNKNFLAHRDCWRMLKTIEMQEVVKLYGETRII